MLLGEKIKKLRKDKGISQQEMADALDITITHVSRLENGHFQPSLDVLKKMVKLFGVSADYLIDENADNVEITIADKSTSERLRLLDSLKENERQAVYTVIDTMLTNHKMRDVLSQQVGN